MMSTTHPARRRHWLRLTLPCVLVAAACGTERSARSAEAAAATRAERAVVESATPERYAELLRAHYAAERACLDRRFPATVIQEARDSSERAVASNEQYARPYELLRGAGLVTRDEVRPGDGDWPMPPKAYVDSGGHFRALRYRLSDLARPNAERLDEGPLERLCYARTRLVAVDSVVVRGLSPGWTPDLGVRHSQAFVFVEHVVAFDSVPSWASEVARRDSLSTFGELRPALLDGPQHRWAEFWVRNGGLMYVGTTLSPPS